MCRLSPLLLLGLAACGAGEPPPTPTTVATASQGTLTGELKAVGALSTGLSTVWVDLRDQGAAVKDATLTLMPLMTMPTQQHACPVVGDVVADGEGSWKGQLVFQMASDEMDTWSLGVKVERPGQDPLTLDFPLSVADSGLASVFSVPDPNDASKSTKYVMSFSVDGQPKVGLNTAVVTLHTMVDMMTFAPFDAATLEMVPEMPAMGHGSSGNLAPTLVSPGRYEGRVNFSMKGEWKTTLSVTSHDVQMTSASFDLVL